MMKPNAATLLNDTKILGINSIRSAVYAVSYTHLTLPTICSV